MSQITRCPSCSTTFKVVADQLRISEGWVRCGQCKEVFDASAHLLAAPPAPLLPDVSLTDVRPPPLPVPRAQDAGRAWGRPSASSPVAMPGAERSSPAAGMSPPQPQLPVSVLQAPLESGGIDPAAQQADGLELPGEAAVDAPTLEVPLPAVPAFLAVAPGDASSAATLELDGVAPFSWRARPPDSNSAARERSPDNADAGTGTDAASSLDFKPLVAPVTPPAQEPVLAPPAPQPPLAAGYELPAPEPEDADDALADADVPVELTSMGYPALELPVRPASPVGEPQQPPPPPAPAAESFVPQDAPVPLPPVDFAPLAASLETEPEALALVEDRSHAAVLQALSRKPSAHKASTAQEDADEGDAADADPEVSFVRAARRKAFWRKPQVRVALVAMILLAVMGLVLQIAIQERDRLAAADSRLRPMLQALCASLHCEIAPQRQIADIVIDSSSFNKARGDSYHLALTMKSKASIPLAMPAVELTLTDAQDQPMLRRVLLPTDMGAPMELPAGGEWSASVSVIVTTGGARVAGYRLLAFYP